jgi:hypothetical protein
VPEGKFRPATLKNNLQEIYTALAKDIQASVIIYENRWRIE